MPSNITIKHVPAQCTLTFGPHQCNLIDCQKDNPEWVHQCYANDFDVTAREVVEFNHNKHTRAEFEYMGQVRAFERIKGEYTKWATESGVRIPRDLDHYDPRQLHELWEVQKMQVDSVQKPTLAAQRVEIEGRVEDGKIVLAEDPWDAVKSKFELTPIAVDQPKPTVSFSDVIKQNAMLPSKVRKMMGLE